MALLLVQVIVSAVVLLEGTAEAQPPRRYTRVSACLNPDSPSGPNCVVCDTAVTVDALRGRNCSDSGRSLAGVSCNSLEDVVDSIAMSNTVSGMGSCVAVLVEPRPGREAHVVLARENRVLRQNVVIRGTDTVGSAVSLSCEVVGTLDVLN